MKWVVLEENPKPNDFIAIVLTDKMKKLKIENQMHSVFTNGDEAMIRAREVRDIFGVTMIRIFRSEGYFPSQ